MNYDKKSFLAGLRTGLSLGREYGTVQDRGYITFTSEKEIGLQTVDARPHWDGILEYSTDAETWSVWNGNGIYSSGKILHLRGTGNTHICDYTVINYERQDTWKLWTRGAGSPPVRCVGNIETLLDYQTVRRGQHPVMAAYCFSGLFEGQLQLASGPDILAPALSEHACSSMFFNCKGLRTTPKISATALERWCCAQMFEGCNNMIELPVLAATTLPERCYYRMFASCTALTLSETQTEECRYAYRIPRDGTGEEGSHAVDGMFSGVLPYPGTPSINTVYYTDHPPVR